MSALIEYRNNSTAEIESKKMEKKVQFFISNCQATIHLILFTSASSFQLMLEWVDGWCGDDIVRQCIPDLSCGGNWKGRQFIIYYLWKQNMRHVYNNSDNT